MKSRMVRVAETASIIFLLGFIIFYFFGVYLFELFTPFSFEKPMDLKSAIIVDVDENPVFISEAHGILTQAGYHVIVKRGKEVSIRFLDKFGGYRLVILRAHSAIAQDGFLYIFSGEEYVWNEYIIEQLSGVYRKARISITDKKAYFALRGDALGSETGLKGSTIILMSCNGTGSIHTIKRLFERGVKEIITWDGYTDPDYVDKATLMLLNYVYKEKMGYNEAAEKVMETVGSDPVWNSRIVYLTET